MKTETICNLIALIEVALAIYLSLKTEIVRDISKIEGGRKPYSLARVQLLWWSVIISVCYIVYYGRTGQFPKLNETCLILLGISIATTATARVIDGTQMDGSQNRHQDQPNRHFIQDILSDEQGVSVHRFQTFLFNIVFGVSFLISFFDSFEFKDFSGYQTTLMGLSSSAYVGLKLTENTTTKPANMPANAVNDTVLDPDLPTNALAVG
jgi:hypothetical protein